MRTDRNIRCWFHGVMLRVEETAHWVHRINFGVGAATRVPPPAGADPSTTGAPTNNDRQWGCEFFHDGANYVGRLYWRQAGTTNFGTPFPIPGLTTSNWSQMVYSILMEQTAGGVLNLYMNTPTGNQGGGLIPSTPISTMTATWTAVSYFGRSINLETAASDTNAPLTAVTFRSALQFIEVDPA